MYLQHTVIMIIYSRIIVFLSPKAAKNYVPKKGRAWAGSEGMEKSFGN
jgi:hypothetical protein